MKEKLKKNKGITLIALVITIIVLLILAGVTLSTLFGNNGILTESRIAVESNKEANAKEQVQLAWMGCETEYQSAWTQDSSVQKSNYFKKENLNKNLGTGTVNDVTYVENGESTILYTLDGTQYTFKIKNGQVYKEGESIEQGPQSGVKPNGPGSAEGSSAEWEFDASTGTILSIKLNDSGVYALNTSTIVIPSTIDGVKVKKIGRLYKDDLGGSFGIDNGGEYLKKVIISDGIEEIGEWAFTNCEMESIEIPDSITKIDRLAFAGCTSLESIRIPGGVEKLEDAVFLDCSSLKHLELCEGIKTLGGSSGGGIFQGCDSLEELYIPASLNNLEDGLYAGRGNYYGNKLKKIEVDDNNSKYDDRNGKNIVVETASNKVVLGCVNSIIPEGITSIGEMSFSNVQGLTTLQLPNTLRVIEGDAFCDSDLTSIRLPDGFTAIEDYAFENADSLTNIYIPNSVQSIGDYAFSYCSLTDITIPSSVTSIGSNAFYWCNKLQAINIAKGSPLSESSSNFPWGTTKEKILFNQ